MQVEEEEGGGGEGGEGGEEEEKEIAQSAHAFLRAIFEGDVSQTRQMLLYDFVAPLTLTNPGVGNAALQFNEMTELIHQKETNKEALWYGQSGIIIASSKGYEDIVELLLSRGANIHDQSKLDGCSPIIAAAEGGHAHIVKLLLSKGANVLDTDNNKLSPLHVAAANGRDDIIADLLAGFRSKPNLSAYEKYNTRLASFALLQQSNQVAYLDAKTILGWSAISYASHYGHISAIVKLIESGADINSKDNDDECSLMKASRQGFVQIVELLLSKGADIHLKERVNGLSSLMIAISLGQTNITKLLLAYGACLRDEGTDGISCYNIARKVGANESIKQVVTKWPASMMIIILGELSILNLKEISFEDFVAFMGEPPF